MTPIEAHCRALSAGLDMVEAAMESKRDQLLTRRHYFHRAQEHIDEQISQLRTKRTDISVEIIRINMRLEKYPAKGE